MTWYPKINMPNSPSASAGSYPRLHKTAHFFPTKMELQFDPQTDARSPWVTLSAHRYDNGLFKFTVGRGFRCDLASVPGVILWLFGPNGRHQRAALFHDAGYEFRPVAQRSAIDEMFRTIMLEDGVPAWKAWLMWAAVRLFGARHWNNHTPPTFRTAALTVAVLTALAGCRSQPPAPRLQPPACHEQPVRRPGQPQTAPPQRPMAAAAKKPPAAPPALRGMRNNQKPQCPSRGPCPRGSH